MINLNEMYASYQARQKRDCIPVDCLHELRTDLTDAAKPHLIL